MGSRVGHLTAPAAAVGASGRGMTSAGRAGISVAMALKLETAGWATADVWLNLQTYYDLAQERNRIGQWPPPNAAMEKSDSAAYAVETDAAAAL